MGKSNRSLKIALPTSAFLPYLGGAEVGLHNIALRLLQRGHQPVVIVPFSNFKHLKQENWDLPYEVASFPPRIFALLKSWPKLGLFLINIVFLYFKRRYRFDFWHTTMGYPTGVTMVNFAQNHNDVHYLIRCAGEDIQCAAEIGYGARLDPVVDALVRKYLPKAKHLVAISESVADEYRALGISESQIEYIPNGVDLNRFSDKSSRNDTRQQLGVADNEILFLAVGRNHKKKNFTALVDAAQIMHDAGISGFRILVVGGGALELASIAEEKNVSHLLLLKEHVVPNDHGASLQLPANELLDFYMAADVFSFPSLIETFGIVLVEAMATKLPIITTDGPGCRDLIRNGEDGIMVPAGDIDALAKEMINVILNPEIRDDLSKRAWKRAQDFSWDFVVDRYIDVYQSE